MSASGSQPADPAALAAFAAWADQLADYPAIAERADIHICIRGGEAHDLLRRAWLAAWQTRAAR